MSNQAPTDISADYDSLEYFRVLASAFDEPEDQEACAKAADQLERLRAENRSLRATITPFASV